MTLKIRLLAIKFFLVFFFVCNLWLPNQTSAFDFQQEPSLITIPAIGVSLPVINGPLTTTTWEVSPHSASYGQYTALPGAGGNTVIFAHARRNMFKDLPQLQKGDIIQVFTQYDAFSYIVEQTLIIDPTEVDVIFSQDKNELTLFTCIGPRDIYRFVVKASLIPQI